MNQKDIGRKVKRWKIIHLQKPEATIDTWHSFVAHEGATYMDLSFLFLCNISLSSLFGTNLTTH